MPQGTYILWVDMSGYGYDTRTIQYIINQKANVAVQSGNSHDPMQGAQYIRICVTSPEHIVNEAIDRISKAFEEYEKEGK